MTEECKVLLDGTVLHRIMAVREFTLNNGHYILPGYKGGWLEKESNLSHDGCCWVDSDAEIISDARICDNALIVDKARIYDNAFIFGNAIVRGYAKVHGYAIVHGEARICKFAEISDMAHIYDNAIITGKSLVYKNSRVFGNCDIFGDAVITSLQDYTVYKNTWSSGRWFTYTRSISKWKVGCFYGTGKELIKKAYKDSKLSGKCYEAIVRVQNVIDRAMES